MDTADKPKTSERTEERRSLNGIVLASVLADNMLLASIICAAILGREEELRGDWPLSYIVALAIFVMRGLRQWESQNSDYPTAG